MAAREEEEPVPVGRDPPRLLQEHWGGDPSPGAQPQPPLPGSGSVGARMLSWHGAQHAAGLSAPIFSNSKSKAVPAPFITGEEQGMGRGQGAGRHGHRPCGP